MDKKEIFKVYEYNKYGIFSKSIILDETDKSPSGAWNIPGGCTDVTPPEETEGFVPVWDGEKWDSVEDHRNETYWLPGEPYGSPGHVMETVGALPEGATTTPPEPTAEELQAQALAELDAEYQAKFDELDDELVKAAALKNETLQDELIAERAALAEEYTTKRGDL